MENGVILLLGMVFKKNNWENILFFRFIVLISFMFFTMFEKHIWFQASFLSNILSVLVSYHRIIFSFARKCLRFVSCLLSVSDVIELDGVCHVCLLVLWQSIPVFQEMVSVFLAIPASSSSLKTGGMPSFSRRAPRESSDLPSISGDKIGKTWSKHRKTGETIIAIF